MDHRLQSKNSLLSRRYAQGWNLVVYVGVALSIDAIFIEPFFLFVIARYVRYLRQSGAGGMPDGALYYGVTREQAVLP